MQAISSKAANRLKNNFKYNGKEEQRQEFSDGSGLEWLDYGARMYDVQIGRWHVIDPLAEETEQIDKSPYASFWNNPVLYDDPDGKCPNCLTAGAGAIIGGVIGGGVELGRQLWNNGKVTSWRAVAGSTAQGIITGGAAGFTGGASLLTTTTAATGANIVGGQTNRYIQGQSTTPNDIALDASLGAIGGMVGPLVGNTLEKITDNLSNSAKGKLGELITETKYIMRGYTNQGKAVVSTGQKTVTGKIQEAHYDFKFENVFSGKLLTVESKFNTSKLTVNQKAAQSNIKTEGGLIIDRTTSNDIGRGASTIVSGAGAGVSAQTNKKEP